MSSPGVPGPGAAPPGALASGIAAVPPAVGPFGVAGCKKDKIHSVKVELRFADDLTVVPAAECKIQRGTSKVNSGPLASGFLESTNLPGGTYTVTFPDIDASEWQAG